MNLFEQMGKKIESRIFGNCPKCKGLDGLVVSGDNSHVKCELCGIQSNESSTGYLSKYANEGNGLLQVTLEKDTMDVTILKPLKIEIPFANLIEDTLNSALMEKFNLEYYFCGRNKGVFGCVKGNPWDYIALTNKPEFLGLQTEDPRMSLSAVPVFDFYHSLLKRLFLEPIKFRNFQYPAGEIVKLPKPQKSYELVLFSLVAAIEDIGGQDFREQVLERLNKSFPLSLIDLD